MSALYTAVIGVVILIVILVLFWYANKKQKQKKEAFNNYFKHLVEQHKLNIDAKDVYRHFVLALDKSNKKLLYIKSPNENPESLLIDLTEVRNCKVAEIVQTFFMDDEKKRKDVLTTQIGLELIYSKTDERLFIPFYDYIAHSSNLLVEMRQRAVWWENELKETISRTKAKN